MTRRPHYITLYEATYITIALVVFLAALMAIVVWSAKPARAHDAIPTAAKPEGWSYPFSCCSSFDCRAVTLGPNGTVRERPEGYVIARTGEVIPYSDGRLKNSPDSNTHWCSVAGKDDSHTICLFIPPRAF